MDPISVNTNKMNWQRAREYPGEAEEKILSAGGDMAPRSILLRIPAGWSMDAHSHRFTEVHYVLEGEYESEGDTFPAGTFRVIPKEVEHGPFVSRQGAIILITWCALKE
jgi:anti-sigma factor ChrR (cupin superfamily)